MNKSLALLSVIATATLSLSSALAPSPSSPTDARRALQLSPEPAPESIEATVTRSGISDTLGVKDDPGVLTCVQMLTRLLRSADGDSIATEVEDKFVADFGASNVEVLQAGLEVGYEWVWDEEHQIWTLDCKRTYAFAVDDGGASELVVELTVSLTLE